LIEERTVWLEVQVIEMSLSLVSLTNKLNMHGKYKGSKYKVILEGKPRD
jgi:hypothetical protein